MYDENAKELAVATIGSRLRDPEGVKRERSAIESESSKLIEALGYLEELISILNARVEPVSYIEPQKQDGVVAGEPKGSSLFYQKIYEAVAKVERLHGNVKDITRRLEV